MWWAHPRFSRGFNYDLLVKEVRPGEELAVPVEDHAR